MKKYIVFFVISGFGLIGSEPVMATSTACVCAGSAAWSNTSNGIACNNMSNLFGTPMVDCELWNYNGRIVGYQLYFNGQLSKSILDSSMTLAQLTPAFCRTVAGLPDRSTVSLSQCPYYDPNKWSLKIKSQPYELKTTDGIYTCSYGGPHSNYMTNINMQQGGDSVPIGPANAATCAEALYATGWPQ